MNKYSETIKLACRALSWRIEAECKALGKDDIKGYKKMLKDLIVINLKNKIEIKKAIDDSYWAVISAIDTDKQLDCES